MKAAEIMSTKVVTIDSLATITEAARVMKQHNLRALIVEQTSKKDAYGIITTTDISQAVANGKNSETTYVCEVMTKPCIVVNPDLSVDQIARLFVRAKVRIAPVIKDKLLGIVSLSDLLQKTERLNFIETNSTPPTKTELAYLNLKESLENEREIEGNSFYENWCSG